MWKSGSDCTGLPLPSANGRRLWAFVTQLGRWRHRNRAVKWSSTDKGYGFITRDDRGKDAFVRDSAIRGHGYKSLAEGTRIEYEVEDGPKGPPARDVRAVASG
jgi:cold shock protein